MLSSDIYFSGRKKNPGRGLLLFVTIAVISLLAIDVLSGGRVRLLVRGAVASFSHAGFAAVDGAQQSGAFSTRASLASRIAELESQIETYKEQAALYASLQDENAKLREIVHLSAKEEGITAPVYSSIRSSPYGTFVIGAGIDGGIEKGDLVVTSGGFVVGRVSEVGLKTSLVTEVFAPGQSIEAVLQGSAVSLEGRGAGNAHTRLPHGVGAQVGDYVVSGEVAGKPVGIVAKTEGEDSSAYTDVYVGLPVNLDALRFVYVEK